MNKHNLIYMLLIVPVVLLAEAEESLLDGIDLSDVVVIEDAPAPGVESSSARAVLGTVDIEVPGASADSGTVDSELPDAALDVAVVDLVVPEIPAVTSVLPSETEVVLELPALEARPGIGTLAEQEVSAGAATIVEEETISVDFPDEDVRTILRNVADLFDLNLVVPDTLQGRTSVKLRNITWRQVFEVVL
ncbi:MAG TPA: hypothetical protein DD423_02365, partial [Opitutae bacterium]|nr:hypothetical protein [Opitutae bacterium]